MIIAEDGLPIGKKTNGSHYNVLCVDDSQFILKQLTHILKSREFEIAATASNGREAIEVYKQMQNDIDFITLDITMPDMDGLETLKNLKELNPNVTIIMITAIGAADAVKQAISEGAKGYIVKPLDRDKVLTRLKQIFVK